MKKLLIPTDFSECSLNAIKYGTELAKEIDAEIILCHAFPIILPGITDTLQETQMLYIETEKDLNAKLEKISKEISSYQNSKGDHLKCSHFLIQSSPTEGIVHYASQFLPDFIIMGTVGNNGWENVLGSTTVGAIRKINSPIIVVPAGASFVSFKGILISIDFPVHNLKSIKYVVEQAGLFHAKVVAGHVSSFENQLDGREKLNVLKEECYEAGIRDLDFHLIVSSHTEKAVIDFIETNDFQLIAMLKERRAFFEGLFHQSFIKQLIMDCKRPLLVLMDE